MLAPTVSHHLVAGRVNAAADGAGYLPASGSRHAHGDGQDDEHQDDDQGTAQHAPFDAIRSDRPTTREATDKLVHRASMMRALRPRHWLLVRSPGAGGGASIAVG